MSQPAVSPKSEECQPGKLLTREERNRMVEEVREESRKNGCSTASCLSPLQKMVLCPRDFLGSPVVKPVQFH